MPKKALFVPSIRTIGNPNVEDKEKLRELAAEVRPLFSGENVVVLYAGDAWSRETAKILVEILGCSAMVLLALGDESRQNFFYAAISDVVHTNLNEGKSLIVVASAEALHDLWSHFFADCIPGGKITWKNSEELPPVLYSPAADAFTLTIF